MTKTGSGHPKIYTIPSEAPFARALVTGIFDRFVSKAAPLALARTTILVPTRRAVRSLSESFVEIMTAQGIGALVLPRIRPVGDVTEEDLIFDPVTTRHVEDGELIDLPPVVSKLQRQFILARLIVQWSKSERGRGYALGATDPAQAVQLGAELGQFLDSLEIEQADPAELENLVPEEFADHWRENLEFLKIVTVQWPVLLQKLGMIDAARRRNLLLAALAARWSKNPPEDPVIVAGSTGSIKATAGLLFEIARLSKGAVVLPGLDLDMDDESWSQIDAVHPQYGMKELLIRMEVPREDVALWSDGGDHVTAKSQARRRLINEALRPADTTDGWCDTIRRFETENWTTGLEGLSYIEAADMGEEAAAIALVLRQALETPQITAALVTPDRDLARRVAAKLRRWGVEIDDSAGTRLSQTPPGTFLRLIADVMAEEAAPIPLLSLLKHPLCACGFPRSLLRNLVGVLEVACLRGPRPGGRIEGVRAALKTARSHKNWSVDRHVDDQLDRLLDRLHGALGVLFDLAKTDQASLDQILEAHIQCAETLAQEDGEDLGAARLWRGDAGEATAFFMRELLDNAADAPPMWGREYAALFSALMAERVVRPRYGMHPRLFIWGPLEARLQHADIMVLGSLNEGSWPVQAQMDPWLSRPMRAALGLAPPERRIGLAAHDFAQLSSAKRVILTRAARVDGAPTVASRWLLRLNTILKGAGYQETLRASTPYLAWARQLDQPDSYDAVLPPAPTPPVAVRPRQFSVTEIATWIRDPYAIYAKKILNLRPLDPIDDDPSHLERGILIHRILDEFISQHKDELPEDAIDELLTIGQDRFAQFADRPGVRAFWWRRFEQIAEWFIDHERQWRRQYRTLSTESRGLISLGAPAGAVTLTARADRIDETDKRLVIVDYKTGRPPTKRQVEAHFAPQLPLEGLIAAQGGFEHIEAAKIERLVYIRLSGGAEPGQEIIIADNVKETMALIEQARRGLVAWLSSFDDPKTPYLASPRPMFLSSYGDYDHLARLKEWSVPGDPDSGAAG